MANFYEITLALAGVCQSAALVQQLAQNGYANELALNTSLQSIGQTTVDNLLEIYGGDERHLKLGLGTLFEQLNGSNVPQALEISRCWLTLLALENKLNKNPRSRSELANRIQYLPTQLQHYSWQDEPILNSLAGMYVDLISPLGRKIQIKGELKYLQQPLLQAKIRACLLAGIRSAVLWRQVGGSKWQILFARKKIAQMANRLYSSL